MAFIHPGLPIMANEFRKEYWFLSNFYPINFIYEGKTYKSVEHFYQSQKAKTPEDEQFVLDAETPGEAKKRGRQIDCQENWEEAKLAIMELALRIKFDHPYLRQKLIETGNELLIEGNSWGDTFWGVNAETGTGENNLGILLMEIRASLRTQV